MFCHILSYHDTCFNANVHNLNTANNIIFTQLGKCNYFQPSLVTLNWLSFGFLVQHYSLCAMHHLLKFQHMQLELLCPDKSIHLGQDHLCQLIFSASLLLSVLHSENFFFKAMEQSFIGQRIFLPLYFFVFIYWLIVCINCCLYSMLTNQLSRSEIGNFKIFMTTCWKSLELI